jgi:dTDP-4-amino-4,6-dideoxygalactose transaminase
LPPFREASRKRDDQLPVTLALAESGLNLPTYNAMTEEVISRICTVIRNAAK